MKTMLIAALAVVIATAGICCWSISYIDEATDELSDMAMLLMDYAAGENYAAAAETIVIMANQWTRSLPVLEMLTDHDDLHTVTEHLVEGQTHLRYRHANDFYQSMALLNESLRHIRNAEEFSLANIL